MSKSLYQENVTIEPTYVPRGSGNNQYGGKRDLRYKIKEIGFIFGSEKEAINYAKEHKWDRKSGVITPIK